MANSISKKSEDAREIACTHVHKLGNPESPRGRRSQYCEPQLTERRERIETSKQAKCRVGPEHRMTSVCGYDKTNPLVTRLNRHPHFHLDGLYHHHRIIIIINGRSQCTCAPGACICLHVGMVVIESQDESSESWYTIRLGDRFKVVYSRPSTSLPRSSLRNCTCVR
jgi:hypothetical protein